MPSTTRLGGGFYHLRDRDCGKNGEIATFRLRRGSVRPDSHRSTCERTQNADFMDPGEQQANAAAPAGAASFAPSDNTESHNDKLRPEDPVCHTMGTTLTLRPGGPGHKWISSAIEPCEDGGLKTPRRGNSSTKRMRRAMRNIANACATDTEWGNKLTDWLT